MTGKTKRIIAVTATVAALGAGGAAVAVAAGGDDNGDDSPDQALTGSAADRARSAAVRAVPGGRVTEVEAADDGASGYEVEVRRADGSVAEVNLDRGFGVVSVRDDD
jgi:uncharacterized membrane protein YkoI